MAFLMDSSCW